MGALVGDGFDEPAGDVPIRPEERVVEVVM